LDNGSRIGYEPQKSSRNRAAGRRLRNRAYTKPPKYIRANTPTQNQAKKSGSKMEQGVVEGCAAHHTTRGESYILRGKGLDKKEEAADLGLVRGQREKVFSILTFLSITCFAIYLPKPLRNFSINPRYPLLLFSICFTLSLFPFLLILQNHYKLERTQIQFLNGIIID
jgi:hypothetical protein